MIASLDIQVGSALKPGSDTVKASGKADAEAVGVVDFALLVDSLALIDAPVMAGAIPKLETEAGTGGNALLPTGNSLPGLPVSQNLEPSTQSAADTVQPDAASRSRGDLAQAAPAKLATPNPAGGETTASLTDRPGLEKPAPAPIPVNTLPSTERLEGVRLNMSPELRAVIDRAASVMVQRLGGVSDGGADKASPPVIRPEAIASALQAVPVTNAVESPVQSVQLGTVPLPAPFPNAATSQPAAAQTPHDFHAVLDRLGEAREAAQTGRASLAVRHEDFGQVSLRLEAAATGMKFALTSTDPDFAPVAQAALAERAVVERTPIERAERAERAPHAETGPGQSPSNNARQETQNGASTTRLNGPGGEFAYDESERSDQHRSQPPKPPRDGALYA